MITTAGRFFAVVVMLAAGAFVVALGIAGGISNRLTVREILLGFAAIVVGLVAALWLRWDRKQHPRGQS
jgi:hypothetical protein